MPVVVVESPAKAKTINGYLGSDYTVLASYGHVRDLPSKDGSVDPEQGFAMEWEIAADSRKHVKAIADALEGRPGPALANRPRPLRAMAICWTWQASDVRMAFRPPPPSSLGGVSTRSRNPLFERVRPALGRIGTGGRYLGGGAEL